MKKSELKDLIKEMLQDQHPLPQDTHATDLNELVDNSVMIQTSKGPYKFWADEDREEDNIKLFHYVKGPDGKEHDVNISPYEINWKSPDMIEKVKKWIESDMPNTKINENNLQENKTTMKKSELKSLISEYVVQTMQENAAQENLKKLVGDTSIEYYFADFDERQRPIKDEIVSYETSDKSLTTKNELTIKYDDKSETVQMYRYGKYAMITFTKESAKKIENIFKKELNIQNIDADYSIPVIGQGNAKSKEKYHADLQTHYKKQQEDPYYDLRARGLVKESKTTMKKSELKALLKAIIQEVVAVKQKRIDETKRLSGFKKPSTSKNMGSIKEDILGMIREAISEMARTAGAVDPQFRKEIEPGKWVIMGHPNQEKYPDGSPTTAPKGPYQKLGSNPNMGRPKKVAPVSSVGGSDFDTATRGAIENILTAAPNTTDSDIMQQLSSSASEEEVSLNLDPAFVKKTASELRKELSADTDNQLDDAPESDLAAMSSSEEKRKAAQRAFIIKKLQAAKRAKQAIK